MTYKIIITDDSAADTAFLRALANQWATKRQVTAEITAYSSAQAFLYRWEEDQTGDLLLFDIEMPGIDGVTLAKTVRQGNRNVGIVFVTGYSDYIAEGYEVSALHYLMKPVDREKFFRTLDRAYERSLLDMQYLTLQMPETLVRLPFREIRWLEVRQNYVTVHAGRDYTLKAPLWELENQLSADPSFFRVGRSYIVNLRCIRQVTKKDIFLDDSTAIPLPRGMYDPLNREIIKRL